MDTNLNTPSKHKIIGPIELLKSASEFLTQNIKSLWSLAVGGPIINIFLSLLPLLFIAFIFPSWTKIGIVGISLIVIVFVALYVCAYLFNVSLIVAIIKRIHYISIGQPSYPPYKIAVSQALPYVFPFIGIFILQGLFIFGASILLIIPGIIVAIYTAFTIIARIVDEKKGRDAILFSIDITWGRALGVFGRLFLTILTVYLIFLGTNMAFGIVLRIIERILDSGIVSFILSVIFSVLLGTLLNTFVVIVMYKLYQELKNSIVDRVRKYNLKKWIIILSVFGVIAIISFIAVMYLNFISTLNPSSNSISSNTLNQSNLINVNEVDANYSTINLK